MVFGNKDKNNNKNIIINKNNNYNTKIEKKLLINYNKDFSGNKIVFDIPGIVAYEKTNSNQKIKDYKTPGLLAIDFSIYEGVNIDNIKISTDKNNDVIAENSSISIYNTVNYDLVNYKINSLDMYVKIDCDIISNPRLSSENILLDEDGRWSLWKNYNEIFKHDTFKIYYQTGGTIGEFTNDSAFLKIEIGKPNNIISGDDENFIIEEYKRFKKSAQFYILDSNDYIKVKDLNGKSVDLQNYVYINDIFTKPLNDHNIKLKSQNLKNYYKSGNRIITYFYEHNDYNFLYKVNQSSKSGFEKLGSGEGFFMKKVNEKSLGQIKLKIEKPTEDEIDELLICIKINEDDYIIINVLASKKITYNKFIDAIEKDFN